MPANKPIAESVLVVEDDPGMSRLLCRWLEAVGYRVRTAECGSQAASMIGEERPDFLLADAELPGMDGRELCRWIRAQSLERYIYMVLITGRAGNDELISVHSGADELVRKPVHKDELLARLRSGRRVLALERFVRELAAELASLQERIDAASRDTALLSTASTTPMSSALEPSA